MQINYEKPAMISSVAAKTVATTETDLMTVTNQNFTRQSQITGYFKITPGSSTNVKIRYYMSPDNGTTWFQVPTKDKTTGALTDLPSIINSTSPTQTGVYLCVEDIPMSATTAIKVTGQATTDVAVLTIGYLFVRDN